MRRTGRSALAQGLAALAVLAGGVVVAATRGTTPVASAHTVLGAVHNASVVSAAGVTRAAVAGDVLNNGDVVVTGPTGAADLNTRGRVTMLGSMAALAVIDGSRQQLRTGTAVVDALHGPALDLDLSGDVVSIPAGSGTEASRGPSVRVGALSGPAAIASTTGRRLAVPALYQAVLSGDALPATTTPLHLTDSVDEDRVAHALVNDDRTLKGLARGIDTTGHSTAKVIEASWTGSTQPIPNAVDRSERVLPVLIADSTHGRTAQDRYNDAVVWRSEGGSWGVVLHLLSGHASAVEATLASLQQHGQTPGQIGTVPTVIAAAGPGGPVQTTPSTHPGRHHPVSHGTTPPASPGGGTTPPPPPPTLLGGLVSTVQTVIDGVLGLLPHHKANGDPTTTTVTKPSNSGTGTTQKSSTTGSPATTVKKTVVKATQPTATRSTTTATQPTPTSSPSTGLVGGLLNGLLGRH